MKRSPLSRGTPLARRTAIRGAAGRRVRTGPRRDVRELVVRRAAGCCERCGDPIGNGPASVHHRLPRRMGGTRRAEVNCPSNLVLLCGTGTTGCHGWVERNRTAALAAGLLLPDGAAPAAEPVLIFLPGRGPRRVRLDDAGRAHPAPEQRRG